MDEQYVFLDRRFRDLTKDEEIEPSLLSHIEGWGHDQGTPWGEILKSERVVILAEAGSGKTKEMLAQAEYLINQGHTAFFIPIEELDTQGVKEYLTSEPGHAERFDNWLANPEVNPAWFFLDSVDELKLVQGRLERAFGRMTSALGAYAHHAHIIVSCRPTDWQPIQDMAIFRRKLPESIEPASIEKTEQEMFLAPIRHEKEEKKEGESKLPKSRCVILLPLDNKRIEIYANVKGVKNSKAFLEEVERKEAWAFARHPLDLQSLVDMWNSSEKIGTLKEQHENNIENSLKDDPERPDNGVISAEKARDGVERLALAMTLTKKRTIRSPEQSTETPNLQSLDAFTILTDWTEAEVKALLRRPIFDPATYGRVRFHHRSIQEYLTARRLSRLQENNLTKRQLNNLLFADTYGERVVIPTMRAVTAWISIGNPDVCRELLSREPEVLVLYGDPESLLINVRRELIKGYVTTYSQGSWRGLEMPIGEVQRLAHTDLATDINTYLEQKHENEEVIEFLLKLIWLGGISDCADAALKTAMDESLGASSRVLAIRALDACGRDDLLHNVAKDIIANEERWQDCVIHSAIENLYPNIISTKELEQLIRRTPEPKSVTDGFSWVLRNLDIPLEKETLEIELINLLTELIWEGCEESQWHAPSSSFGYLSASLARFCKKQIEKTKVISPALMRSVVIANRFNGGNYSRLDELEIIREVILKEPSLRETAFWTELETMDAIPKNEKSWKRMYHVLNDGLMTNLQYIDWVWLLATLSNRKHPEKREIALQGLISIWYAQGKPDLDLQTLEISVENEPNLKEILAKQSQPLPADLEKEKWEIEHLKHVEEQKAEQQAVEQSWLDWKTEAESDPDKVFEGETGKQSMWTLMKWLRYAADNTGTLTYKNWSTIRKVMGEKIGKSFEEKLKLYWREVEPPIWSSLTTEKRNSVLNSHYAGLTGLHVEASKPNWIDNLTDEEVTRTAEWALVECNGFPEWFVNLAEKHPDIIAQVLDTELKAELAEIDTIQHPHTLHAIAYGPVLFKKLAAPYLKHFLQSETQKDIPDSKSARNQSLHSVLAIVIDTNMEDEVIVAICESQFLNAPNAEAAAIWLNGLCACNLSRGLEAFKVGLKAIPEITRQSKAIEWFGRIFSDGLNDTTFVSMDADADTLVNLTELAYEQVKRGDDIRHESSYSPGDRDNAQDARNRILNSLIDKPGSEAHKALIQLADKPLFSHIQDRIKILARQRAAKDSDIKLFSVPEFREWEMKYEVSPSNRDDLFELMMGRHDDIEHDIQHDEFTVRQTLQNIKREEEIQPWLAQEIRDISKGHYQVDRESEVADKKKTDIRLLTGAAGKSVIEIKVGDHWSVRQLEEAIEMQLVGQYLRHKDCTVGVLLVTYAGRKRFKNVKTNQWMSFDEVIQHLQNFANDIETKEQGRVRLAVKGLDLRNPLTKS